MFLYSQDKCWFNLFGGKASEYDLTPKYRDVRAS